jgi:hypothetical protein
MVIKDMAGQTYGFDIVTGAPNITLDNCVAPIIRFSPDPNNFWCNLPTNPVVNNPNSINGASTTIPGQQGLTPAGRQWRTSTHDFNGDGFSDILLQDTVSGSLVVWLYQAGVPIVQGPSLGNLNGFTSVGQHDVDQDGKSDLFWQDNAGNVSVWAMNGTSVAPPPNTAHPPTWAVAPLPGYSVAGVGDFNNDGMGDLLVVDANSNYAVLLLNGVGSTVINPNGNLPLGNIPSFQVAGIGDFNHDGYSDILWKDPSGNVAIWLMYGGQVAPPTVGMGNVETSWAVVGVGDFNGDGIADILWRDSSGNVAIWLMNNVKTNPNPVLSSVGLGKVPTTFSIAATGDYNNDGMTDILLRDTAGDTSIWFMNGTTVASTAVVGDIPTNWKILSNNAQ